MIQHTQLFFQNPLNVSVQIGDFVYYARTVNAPQSGNGTQFQINNNDMHEVGQIVDILSNPTTLTGFVSNNSIICRFDCTSPTGDCLDHLPGVDDLIMFSKDNAANMTSILGYYAEVEMVNDSSEKAKLFAVSTDVTESSK
tara:strand:- start:614 stop:1036 length:423 start_codon:yes stop_codon:yes gene_type:complete